MKIAELILGLNKKGIILRLVNGKLKVSSTVGSVSDESLSVIRQKKDEIVNFLSYVDLENHYQSIPKSKLKDSYQLTPTQRRLFTLQQLNLDSTAYNIQLLYPLNSNQIEKERLEIAFNYLIERHESLRTYFEFVDHSPVQKVKANASINISHLKLEKSKLVNGNFDFIQPFNLHEAPLIRVVYIEIENGDRYILIDMHHIITDGISNKTLIREFNLLLDGKFLPQLTLQYKDYAEWINSKIQKDRVLKQRKYWIDAFSSHPPKINLPIDYKRPTIKNFEGASVSFFLTNAETQILKEIADKDDLTLFMVLLAVYYIFLTKVTRQEDIVVGSPVTGRQHNDLDRIVGPFLNTLPIRAEIKDDIRIKDFFEYVKHTVLEILDNQEYQFEDLIEDVSINRDLSRNPLFDVMLNLLNYEDYNDVLISSFDPNIHTKASSKFDLTLTAVDFGNQIIFNLCYSTSLFKAETIDRFIGYIKQIISQLPNKYEREISTITIISEEERTILLSFFNDTKFDYNRNTTIQQMFELQVEKNPKKLCVVFEDKSITYERLNEKSNQLARHLRNNEIGKNAIVSLLVDPSVELMVCILAVLKSGAAYLPIDPALPDNRILNILIDSECNLILTNRNDYNELLAEFRIVNVNEKVFIGDDSNLCNISEPSDPVYVIYTSGTSGLPKGVVIKHENLINYISWLNSIVDFDNDKTVLVTSYAYDLGYTSIYSSVLNGGELHLLNKDYSFSILKFVEYLVDKKITYLKITPSLYSLVIDADGFDRALVHLKYLFLGGEQINVLTVEKSLAINKSIQIFNHYGPTETTIGCIFKLITYKNLHQFKITPVIGKPINNTLAYILDNNNEILPIGVAGQLCIGGEGLAEGYLNNQMLTKSKFIDNPFVPGTKLYLTGDLASRLGNGDIQIHGRVDNQIKIHGFRVELKEIEYTLSKHHDIRECVVIAHEENSQKYICAYLIVHSEVKEEYLRSYLLQELPDYMIPQYFVFLTQLPLNKNGKVDLSLLPLPEIVINENIQNPQNETEEEMMKIWSDILTLSNNAFGINDSFFALGGNSLKAIRLISEVKKSFDIEISIKDVFYFSTVKHLAGRVIFLKEELNETLLSEIIALSKEDLDSLLGDQ